MRNRTVLRWKSMLLAIFTVVLVSGAYNAIVAQEKGSIGAKYGSREPRTCADMKIPARGAITAALAAKYFICAAEKEDSRYLYLVDNVKTEVGVGRPYNRNMDINLPQIDVRFPVYPIRGSHTQYQCNPESDYYGPGKNCNRYEHQNANGFCYKTTFGDWRCYQADQNIPTRNEFFNVAPPKGENAAANKAVNDKPADPKTANDKPGDTKPLKQNPETKAAPNADRNENGLVKPDFSELEKDFEIMKYEYDTSTRPPAIYITARVKRSNRGRSALSFEGRFYDADGVNIMVPAERVWVINGDSSKVGEGVKLRVWTPSESQIRNKVKKIVVTRIIE